MSWKRRNLKSRHRACAGKFAQREARQDDLRGEGDKGGEGVSEERDEDGDGGIEVVDIIVAGGEGGGCNECSRGR